jgi:predicted nucleic acid-binding protein
MIYLDSCAIVKLVRVEPESAALRAWLAANPQPLVTSALARVEATRALRRIEPAALHLLPLALATMHHHPITDTVLSTAIGYEDPYLRSLDAIHLASAQRFQTSLQWFLTYDHRLIAAAERLGLSVASPGSGGVTLAT